MKVHADLSTTRLMGIPGVPTDNWLTEEAAYTARAAAAIIKSLEGNTGIRNVKAWQPYAAEEDGTMMQTITFEYNFQTHVLDLPEKQILEFMQLHPDHHLFYDSGLLRLAVPEMS